MKSKLPKLHIGHFISIFLASVIGLSLSYLFFNNYTHSSSARSFDLLTYLSLEKKAPDVTCPQLKSVTTASGTTVLKDACTGTYWYSMDLPILDKNDKFKGYTWAEAKTACDNLATADLSGTKVNIFRLPTVDELLTLVKMPCTDANACSPLTDFTSKLTDNTTPVTTNFNHFLKKQNKTLGNGSYWAANEFSAETAGSVNLQIGMVNNPVLGKGAQLNVRCIYKAPDNMNVGNLDEPGDQIYWSTLPTPHDATTVNVGAGVTVNASKYKINYRSNIQTATCPAPFTGAPSGSSQCTAVSADTDQRLIFSCGNNKPYRRMICDNTVNAGTPSVSECVTDGDCSGRCIPDVNFPIGCKDPTACFAGSTFYESKTADSGRIGYCENEPGRDCRIGQSPSDCVNAANCLVPNGICHNDTSKSCTLDADCAGSTCDAQGECLNEKNHVCPALKNKICVNDSDGVAVNPLKDCLSAACDAGQTCVDRHIVYNTASNYAQRYDAATQKWLPTEDWDTDYQFTPSNIDTPDCRFTAQPGYFWSDAMNRAIPEREFSCRNQDLPKDPTTNLIDAEYSVRFCSNDANKGCHSNSDCGTGNKCLPEKKCTNNSNTCELDSDCGTASDTCTLATHTCANIPARSCFTNDQCNTICLQPKVCSYGPDNLGNYKNCTADSECSDTVSNPNYTGDQPKCVNLIDVSGTPSHIYHQTYTAANGFTPGNSIVQPSLSPAFNSCYYRAAPGYAFSTAADGSLSILPRQTTWQCVNKPASSIWWGGETSYSQTWIDANNSYDHPATSAHWGSGPTQYSCDFQCTMACNGSTVNGNCVNDCTNAIDAAHGVNTTAAVYVSGDPAGSTKWTQTLDTSSCTYSSTTGSTCASQCPTVIISSAEKYNYSAGANTCVWKVSAAIPNPYGVSSSGGSAYIIKCDDASATAYCHINALPLEAQYRSVYTTFYGTYSCDTAKNVRVNSGNTCASGGQTIWREGSGLTTTTAVDCDNSNNQAISSITCTY